MAIIPKIFMESVVAIGIDIPKKPRHWLGTGFIVGKKEKNDPKLSTFYLITNKHVVEHQTKIYVRFNALEGDFIKDYPIELYREEQPLFSSHPNPQTDIIALQIAPQTLINDKSVWGFFDLEDHALTLQQMKQTDVMEGSLVYALGFPMNLVETIKAPICRIGCISRIQDAFIKAASGESPTFFVDIQAFPGNSGGPVISRPETLAIEGTKTNSKANLIGILSAYLPYQDTLISQQTGQAIMIREENSGLTIVHPVNRIKEVVELEYNRIKNLSLKSN